MQRQINQRERERGGGEDCSVECEKIVPTQGSMNGKQLVTKGLEFSILHRKAHGHDKQKGKHQLSALPPTCIEPPCRHPV